MRRSSPISCDKGGGGRGGYMYSISFNAFFNGVWAGVNNFCCSYFCCCFVGIFWARSKGWVNICWQNRKKSGCHKGIRCFSLTQMLSPKKSCDLQYQRPQQWFFKFEKKMRWIDCSHLIVELIFTIYKFQYPLGQVWQYSNLRPPLVYLSLIS